MEVTAVAEESKQITIGLDWSGQPSRRSSFVVAAVIVQSHDLTRTGEKLQGLRDRSRCETSIHFADLHKVDADSRAAESFVRAAVDSDDVGVKTTVRHFPPGSVDLSKFPDVRTACNRQVMLTVKAALGRLSLGNKAVDLQLLIDGQGPIASHERELEDYLSSSTKMHCDKSEKLPCLVNIATRCVSKRPLFTRGTIERAQQDVVAVADLMCASTRRAADQRSAKSLKPKDVLANMLWNLRQQSVADRVRLNIQTVQLGSRGIPFTPFGRAREEFLARLHAFSERYKAYVASRACA